MSFPYFINLLLLWTVSFVSGGPYDGPTDVTYNELEKLNASCNTLDNCKSTRHNDMLTFYTCHCGSFCADLDTCCIDSPFRREKNSRLQSSCKNPHGTLNSHYFIRDECPLSSDTGDSWKKLCKDDSGKDLLSVVPVTSLSTNMTYKNYFCFRCNERGSRYHYWNIKIFTDVKLDEKDQKKLQLTYNRINHTWVAPIGEKGSIVPVALSVEVPGEIQELPKLCVPNVISSCSNNWKDDVIRQKCSTYTSIVYFVRNEQTLSYRNPHCALCNFEILENMLCAVMIASRSKSKKPFSFTYLLDINRMDGERVGENQQCADNAAWDPFFEKCRILKCALPGHVVQNGECTPP